MTLLKQFFPWLPAALLLMLLAWVVKIRFTQMRRCTIDDLPLMLRRADVLLLEELLDPQAEAALRKTYSSAAFRAMQTTRIVAAQEQLGRIYHNSEILLRWAHWEDQKVLPKNPVTFTDRDIKTRELLRCAAAVKKDVVGRIVKIGLWRIAMMERWVFLPSPSLSDLRERRGVDILQSYEGMVSAAGHLSISYGQEKYDQMMHSLGV